MKLPLIDETIKLTLKKQCENCKKQAEYYHISIDKYYCDEHFPRNWKEISKQGYYSKKELAYYKLWPKFDEKTSSKFDITKKDLIGLEYGNEGKKYK